MRSVMVLSFCLLGPQVGACPMAADISDEIGGLIDEARAAGSEMAGRDASNRMRELWLKAPDAAAQELLDQGMSRRRSYDFAGAIADFDRLVAYCPDYAEGYNQRAFVHFLAENYEAALVDLDKTLTMAPNHVGAQSRRALTLMNLGHIAEARSQMLAALENNPWLSERALVAQGAILGTAGEDI